MVPKKLRPLVPYLKRHRNGLFLGGFCVLFNNGVWILFPQVLRRAINDLNTGVTRHKLLTYSLMIIAIALIKGIFQFLTRWVVIGISRDIEFDLRNDLFAHLERLSYSYYQRNRTGDIMARATNDLNAVRMLLGPAIMYSANTIVFTAGALGFMLAISPKLTVFAFLPLPIASVVIQYFGRRIHERFERIQAMFSDISARAQENFSGARVIRAYVQEQSEIAAFENANQEYIRRSLGLVRLMGMLWPTLELMLGAAVVIVLWMGGREVINGQSQVHLVSYLRTTTTLSLSGSMDVGAFVAFNTYMMQLTWPVIALGWVINIFQRGTASMVRINEILSQRPEIRDEIGSSGDRVIGSSENQPQGFRDFAPQSPEGPITRSPDVIGEIEFRHLNFAYNGTPVLKDINLRIPAGSSLAIVGPTGSGKTTLVSLIPRIYDAAPGAVLIDGRPLRDFPLDSLRRNIGFVPQETFLFSDTIRENIAYGVAREDATPTLDEIKAAAEAANISADIEGFPEGYNTTVGERGITLSGGQKQRTAIARALLRSPRILILDDALSSVDTHTEDKILNHLREIMRGRTTIFISHRVSTVRNADAIAVLHQGRIVELGTHDQLIARNGYYTDLYNKQLLEEELAEV
ncbi:MAG TPA: ABC transporter ATP-binding protein [Terriglobales bacterium]|jgi:ATP-binding cassette subfamily B multidrug efflux pump|nr:ABC transporter ATP-binding protein [Terriglobales bacterium]